MNSVKRNIRAMVRVIEGLEILKEDAGSWRERLLINPTLALYTHRLEVARRLLPPAILEQIEKELESV